jgi:hypothetical protein
MTRTINCRITYPAGRGLKGKMMSGLHRVVIFGNHQQSIQDLAGLMGIKVAPEIWRRLPPPISTRVGTGITFLIDICTFQTGASEEY